MGKRWAMSGTGRHGSVGGARGRPGARFGARLGAGLALVALAAAPARAVPGHSVECAVRAGAESRFEADASVPAAAASVELSTVDILLQAEGASLLPEETPIGVFEAMAVSSFPPFGRVDVVGDALPGGSTTVLHDARYRVDAADGGPPVGDPVEVRLDVGLEAIVSLFVDRDTVGAVGSLAGLQLFVDVLSDRLALLATAAVRGDVAVTGDAGGLPVLETAFTGTLGPEAWTVTDDGHHAIAMLVAAPVELVFEVDAGATFDVQATLVAAATIAFPDGVSGSGVPAGAGTAAYAGAHERVVLEAAASDPDVRLTVLAVADRDGDGLPNHSDNCPDAANASGPDAQADADGDGIGDACECGDADGDGRLATSDARVLQRCAVGLDPCPRLCDADGNGVCGTSDARLVQRVAVGQLQKSALACAERPRLD